MLVKISYQYHWQLCSQFSLVQFIYFNIKLSNFCFNCILFPIKLANMVPLQIDENVLDTLGNNYPCSTTDQQILTLYMKIIKIETVGNNTAVLKVCSLNLLEKN